MYKEQNIKLFAIISFALSIVLAIFLLNGINSEKESSGTIYLLAILLFILIQSGLLFLIFQMLKKAHQNTNVVTVIKEEEKKEETTISKKQENIQTIDFNEFSAKILPKADKDNSKYTESLLKNLAQELELVQGLCFLRNKPEEEFQLVSEYAFFGEDKPHPFTEGQTLSGQVAKNKKILNLEEVPEGYITVISGLGSISPSNLLIIPLIKNNITVGIIEIASFKKFEAHTTQAIEKLADKIVKNLAIEL